MSQIHILKTGYGNEDEKGIYHASATCTLVLNDEMKIIVDPGGAWERKDIIERLLKFGVDCEDIDIVVGTHGHSDHIGNLNLFPKAKQIVGFDINTGDHYETDHDFKSGLSYPLIEGKLEVLPTPGHMHHDVSLIVYDSLNSEHGVVGICGDLFENSEDDGVWQEISENVELQSRNRNVILDLCHHIVPGHGNMFKNPLKKS
eukprot:TCONS_00018868-protein